MVHFSSMTHTICLEKKKNSFDLTIYIK